MPEQVDMLKFKCDCGARLKAPAAAVGRRIRCPKCKRAFIATDPDAPAQVVERPASTKQNVGAATKSKTVKKRSADSPARTRPTGATAAPKSKPSSAKKAAPEPPPPTDDDWLSDLAASEHQAESTGETVVVTEKQEHCPNCTKPLPVGAKKCPLCGHSKAVPQKKKKKSDKAKVAAGAAGMVALKTGRFFVGCALSLVGALLGAGIWMGIAAIFEIELGYVAIALGAMAGFGMVIGYGDQNLRAGLAASVISLGGIVVAKIGLVIVLPISMALAGLGDIDFQRVALASSLTQEAFESRGIYSSQQQAEQWDAVYADMESRVSAMSDDEVTEALETRLSEEDSALNASRDRLARFRADRAGDLQKLAFFDPAREDLYNTECASIKDWSIEQLDQELKEVDVWEASGQWHDDAYLLVFLADRQANEAAEKDPSLEGLEDDPAWFDQWNVHYQSALADAEQMTATARSDAVAGIRQADEKQAEAFRKEMEEALAESGGGGASVAWGAAFFALFGPFDILFTLLAVGAAFKIAGGTD